MTTKSCTKKHTPITSKAQQGLFGAELARRREGKKGKMEGISTKELESHLRESKGKKLSSRAPAPKGIGKRLGTYKPKGK